jgi:hypothetical protein
VSYLDQALDGVREMLAQCNDGGISADVHAGQCAVKNYLCSNALLL